MKSKHDWAGHSAKEIPRQRQPNFNPPPGASPQAAAAPKADIKKRENPDQGFVKNLVNKLISAATPSPTPAPNTQSANAMADRKDQTDKLGNQ